MRPKKKKANFFYAADIFIFMVWENVECCNLNCDKRKWLKECDKMVAKD